MSASSEVLNCHSPPHIVSERQKKTKTERDREIERECVREWRGSIMKHEIMCEKESKEMKEESNNM